MTNFDLPGSYYRRDSRSLASAKYADQQHHEELIKTERIRKRRAAWEGLHGLRLDPPEAEEASDVSRE